MKNKLINMFKSIPYSIVVIAVFTLFAIMDFYDKSWFLVLDLFVILGESFDLVSKIKKKKQIKMGEEKNA